MIESFFLMVLVIGACALFSWLGTMFEVFMVLEPYYPWAIGAAVLIFVIFVIVNLFKTVFKK